MGFPWIYTDCKDVPTILDALEVLEKNYRLGGDSIIDGMSCNDRAANIKRISEKMAADYAETRKVPPTPQEHDKDARQKISDIKNRKVIRLIDLYDAAEELWDGVIDLETDQIIKMPVEDVRQLIRDLGYKVPEDIEGNKEALVRYLINEEDPIKDETPKEVPQGA